MHIPKSLSKCHGGKIPVLRLVNSEDSLENSLLFGKRKKAAFLENVKVDKLEI